jgi:hypothetical protein
MDIKERNIIIGVVIFFIGFITIISIVPILIGLIIYSSHFNILIFIDFQIYIYFDLVVLAITLLLYAYFIVRPIKSLKGKKILAIVTMIFGGVLVVIPLIGTGFQLYRFLDSYLMHPQIIIGQIFLFALLLPGIILFIHGWYMRKNLRIENNS